MLFTLYNCEVVEGIVMSFTTISNVSYINGQSGGCDNKVKDPNVKYGRNAMWNYYEYLNEMGFGRSDKLIGEDQTQYLTKDPSLNSSLKYLPEEKPNKENLNKMALLGASFVDLGNKLSIPLAQMNKLVKNAFGENATAEAFDINNDGQIDLAENATALLIKDMAGKVDSKTAIQNGNLELNADNIDGTITNVGENNFGAFVAMKNLGTNKQTTKAIYETFQLNEAKNIFEKDPNNMIN